MTLRNSLPEKTHSASKAYFVFLLKQNWPAFVTNLIILLLVNVVFLSMVITNDYTFAEGTAVQRMATAYDNAQAMRLINVVLAALLAVLWGSGTMTYVNTKVGVHFYHSIPLTRGQLYVSEIAVKVITLAVPTAISVTLGMCANSMLLGSWQSMVVSTYLSAIPYAILYFVFYLSIMVFAASFSGNAFSRLMSAGLVVFMPSALLLFVTAILNYSAFYTDYDPLLQLALEFLSPYRIIIRFTEPGYLTSVNSMTMLAPLGETILAVVIAALFFIAGYLIYRLRKSELSGLPILSKVASVIIKYTCMFCAASAMGYIFDAFGDTGGYFIGAVVGSLLCLMLVNVILTKSAKQMFKGWKGAGIFTVGFLAFFFLFGLDLIGFDYYIPSAAAVRKLTLSVGGELELPVQSEADEKYYLDTVRAYMDEIRESGDHSPGVRYETAAVEYIRVDGETLSMDRVTEITEEDLRDMLLSHDRTFTLRMTIQPHFGFPIEKRISVSRDEFAEFLNRVESAENFAEAYFPIGNAKSLEMEEAYIAVMNMTAEYDHIGLTSEAWAIIDALRNSYNGPAYFQRSCVASLYYRGHWTDAPAGYADGRMYSFQLHYYDAPEKYMNQFLANVNAICILDTETNELYRITDRTKIKEIAQSLCQIESGRYGSVFTDLDSRYAVGIERTREIYDDYGYEDYGKTELYTYMTYARFLKDQVPNFK